MEVPNFFTSFFTVFKIGFGAVNVIYNVDRGFEKNNQKLAFLFYLKMRYYFVTLIFLLLSSSNILTGLVNLTDLYFIYLFWRILCEEDLIS